MSVIENQEKDVSLVNLNIRASSYRTYNRKTELSHCKAYKECRAEISECKS